MSKQQQFLFLMQYTLRSIFGRKTVATVGQSHIMHANGSEYRSWSDTMSNLFNKPTDDNE